MNDFSMFLKRVLIIFIKIFIIVIGAWIIKGLYILVRNLWKRGRG